MKRFLVPLLVFSTSAFSQDFLRDIEAINQEIGQQELDSYLEKPDEEGVPGPFLQSLMPDPTLNPETVCEEDGEPKNTHYEVVLVSEVNSRDAELEILPGQRAQFHTNDLRFLVGSIPETMASRGLSPDAVVQRARDIWTSGYFNTPSPEFDPNTALGRELLIESIVHASAKSTLSETDLSRQIASTIGSVYTSEESRFNALSALSLRLYRNYNNARNPGFDNPKNNPFGVELPPGDMTINELMKSSSEFDVFQGGVCNDISEVVAQVGEHLFPDKDVLTINSGSHFGVLLTDGENHRVIDGGNEFSMANHLMLDPNLTSSNLRINKVVNGEQRQIAVVDTEMGQLTEAAFETGKNLLKTDADISKIVAHLKKNNFGVSVGVSSFTDNSNVVIVVAKYENAGEKWRSYIGAGLSAQDFSSDLASKYQVHFRAGVERNMFSYVNPRTEVNFATGVRASGMYTINQPRNDLGGVGRLDMSGALDVYNRLEVNYGRHNPDGVQVNSSVEVEHTVGPTNWGNTTGALSYMEPRDTGTILKNITFHLNQVNANVTAEKRVNDSVTGFTSANYQGSNVGQSVSVMAGLNIRAPAGAQLLVFTGYRDSEIGGFKTQHSLLGGPSGGEIGAQYTTRRGIQFSGGVRGIGDSPVFQGTIRVPLGRRR